MQKTACRSDVLRREKRGQIYFHPASYDYSWYVWRSALTNWTRLKEIPLKIKKSCSDKWSHLSGCRPSEALELVVGLVLIEEKALVFRSLKKRKQDAKGRIKQPQFRTVPVPVPVPEVLIEQLDYVYEIRRLQKTSKGSDFSLWTMSRPTAYRLVKRVMDRAGIVGQQATGKGLRHGFGVAMLTAKKPLPLHVLAQLMGHTDSKTTEIYLQVVGEEKRQMVTDAWEG